ncbi:ATP-binding protein [Christiangramia fulva]|uniref:ATP-binding protein n=1 Tax=Christiangramia fulva TaxID=2126553 RepID=UPI00131AD4C6|nr:ATP-binding protein [Christiangramia fulva]
MKLKFRHSIVTRFALFFTALIIFSILVSGFIVFQKASAVIIDYSKENLKHSSEMAEQSFYSLLKEVSNDVAVIAESPSLKNYINNPSEENSGDVENLFRITLENKEDYFQIRYIGIENNGKEIIRYEKLNDKVSKADTLQEKGDREYFLETLHIAPGEFYFSPINLNEEYGVISDPPTPTLRAASPIFNNNGKVMGVLVINVDMSRLYAKFKQISRQSSQFYLVDKNGQYLYSPNREEQFALQKHTDHNFFSDYNIVLNQDHHFELVRNGSQSYLTYLKELEYFRGKRKIYLVTSIKQNILLASERAVQLYSLRTLLLVCIISILISWLFTNFFSKKINQITKAISNYESDPGSEIMLPVNRKDEIGVLANSFLKMKKRINNNVKELNTALKKEKQAKRQRDEFLQNMSHELRTPLNSILGLTQILHKQSTSEAQRNIIASLEKSAKNLAGLVYDVLDHQKLVEGKLQIAYKPVNIARLLKDIHSTYQFEALQKGLSFSLVIDKKLEENKYLTDPLRLSQIITNLVVNAVKYTREGEISLSAEVKSGKNARLEIKISDTGIGILEENLSRINDRFFREKEEMDGRFGGYGLGLSIVKQLTELFGGSLKAISAKGKGSEFTINIPVEKVNVKKKLKSSSSRYILPKFKKTYNLLYIEDDLSSAEMMKYILDDDKLLIKKVDKIESAREILENGQVDLVISDLMLEDVNLTDILKEWISFQKLKAPIIVLSALEAKEVEKITSLYFQKPYDIFHVQDLVYYVLGKNEFQAPDLSNIYNNYDHDPEKVSKVLKLLHEEFGTYLKRINDAAESKNQKDWKAILHKLVANLNNLKLSRLKETIPEEVSELDEEKLEFIRQNFAYCQCCFRNERRFNLRDRSF